jgi:hypothetical protein
MDKMLEGTPPNGLRISIPTFNVPQRRAKDSHRPFAAGSVRMPKRDRRTKVWQHPLKRQITVPYGIAAAIAIMEMGISDHTVIARAVGLTVEEVERIDSAEDTSVRQLAVARIPIGEFFKLITHVRCPGCHNDVSVVPCVSCCSY